VSAQLERSLQAEVLLRLGRFPVVCAAIPNGLWIPARTEQEKALVARIIARMRNDGQITPGAPDLFIAGARGALCVELKRPVSRDLFGRRPKGRLSPDQMAFKARCESAGVPYLVAYGWDDIASRLGEIT
jgi:VRR-NUC domain-containing protein